MLTPIIATKLYIPPLHSKVVLRSRLIERLNEGLLRKLTLISAPAGFGKTTLVSEWLDSCGRPCAWLSLDDGDKDPARFLTYLIMALQTIEAHLGEGILAAIRSPQPPSSEAILTSLLNEIAAIADDFLLVLDDYHMVDAQAIDHALSFMVDHLPPQMHLVIATREDPQLPLARLRARSQLTELRIKDLRFTLAETTGFLNQLMGLNLSTEDIMALETRTEGWIAGLQLAAISMQGHHDATNFIKSFTGSHHFVLDYLVEEVLQQQPEGVQNFLLRTSILQCLCASLCDAVLHDTSASSQASLEYIEHANLFIIPLDNERQWYRYHPLFADLLRQRLRQISSKDVDELHIRASHWYEDNGLEIEAFHHAVAAHAIERAAYLIEGKGMPLQFRGAAVPVLNWLASLPQATRDANPFLWVMYASSLSMTGQTSLVEEKLQAAEAALQGLEENEKTRNLIGHIAAIRALLAATQYQIEAIITQSCRALEYLHPNNLPVRTATIWKLGIAYHLQGDRPAASQAYSEAMTISRATGNIIVNVSATIGLGNIQELDNQLYLAAQTYRQFLEMAGAFPPLLVCKAHLGLAQINYQWNDLDAAQQHGQQALQLARQIEKVDQVVACEVFLARLKLTLGDVSAAVTILAQAEQSAHQHNFVLQMPDIAAAQVLTLLYQGNLSAAAHLAVAQNLPMSQARVYLAQGDSTHALALLEPLRQQMEAKGWQDERLKVMLLQSLAYHAQGEQEAAVQVLADALVLAQAGGFIRLFVDEGLAMAQLLSELAARGMMPDYVDKLLAAFPSQEQRTSKNYLATPQALIDPLSQRELEVLHLIALGLSNQEISERLFLALSTVKGHNRIIFDKLGVKRRTEAVARSSELGLLQLPPLH